MQVVVACEKAVPVTGKQFAARPDAPPIGEVLPKIKCG